MKQLITIFSILFLSSLSSIQAQNTVGLLSYNPGQAFDGYNLVFPHNQGSVFLLNNCGEIVNRWDDPVYKPGNIAYLQPNGNLYIAKGRNQQSNSWIHAGGAGEKIEIRDWNNTLLWSFTYNDSLKRLHHDISVLPNGNILAIAWERKFRAEVVAAGRDTTKLVDNELWPDHIIEIEPNLSTGAANIVWEWHVWDHLVQDFDATKANFGVVAANPQLVNLNYTPTGQKNWMHVNAIHYNEVLDQIVISVPLFDEIWIIDHSTTTAQAASHSGGLAGKGGDLLYRFGNQAAYNMGDSTNQKLFFQHDIHWMDLELGPSHPDFGKLMVYNNRVGADYSTVNVFDPVFDTYNWEYPMTAGVWGPSNFEWTYTRNVPQDMYSPNISSAQRLQNGNTLICAGQFGYSFEVTPTGNIVWEYKTPLKNGAAVSQGDTTLTAAANNTFRLKRYSTNYPAFTGRTLNSMGYIELNPDTTFCSSLLTATPLLNDSKEQVQLFPNPAKEYINLVFQNESNTEARLIDIIDMYGRQVKQFMSEESNIQLSVNDLPNGLYIIRNKGKLVAKFTIIR